MADNLQETPLTSLRSVYDEIAQHGSVRSFPIDSLLITCQSTGTKFWHANQQKQEDGKHAEKASKRKQVAGDLIVIKKQKMGMEKLAEILDTDANKLLSKACKSGNLQEMKKLVTEPDSSKKSSKVKKKLVGEYKATIQKLEKKLS